MKVIREISYSEKNNEKLDVYLPDKNNFRTVICFHGGGLECHGKDTENFIQIAESFLKAGYAFVSANYRIYPDAKFPEFIQDAAEAISFVKKNVLKWKGNGEIIVTGQSAGAWISLMLCFNKVYLNEVGIDPLEIKAWIIDSAQTTAHFNVLKHEKGESTKLQRINEYAPQYFVNEKTVFTKILLIVYENDMPCRYEQNMLFYRSILLCNKDADISYEILPGGHCHGSSAKDEDGEYAYVKAALKWLRSMELAENN